MNLEQPFFYKAKFYFIYKPILVFFVFLILFLGFGIVKGILTDFKYLGFVSGFFLFYLNYRNNVLNSMFRVISEFNNRYNELNDHLLLEDKCSPIKIFDYFNLCAEEYYFYKHGLYPQDVWNSWYIGMQDFFQKSYVKKIAIAEFKTPIAGSYYGFDPFKLDLMKE